MWRAEGLAAQTATGIVGRCGQPSPRDIETRRDVELGSLTALVDIPGVNINIIPDLLFPLDWLLGWAGETGPTESTDASLSCR